MQPVIPNLEPLEARTLAYVKQQGVVRGQELVHEFSGLERDTVIDAVRKLASLKLLLVKGDLDGPAGLVHTYLSFRPSATPIAEIALGQAAPY